MVGAVAGKAGSTPGGANIGKVLYLYYTTGWAKFDPTERTEGVRMINTAEIWMMSNRQPWPEALLRGLITCKTRSLAVNLPPVGATVYLHASKALWVGWQNLRWVNTFGIDMAALDRGGVVGVATVAAAGLTDDIMPQREMVFFDVYEGRGSYWNCADGASIQFKDIQRLPFIPCRGAQVPTRKLPPELQMWLVKHG